MSALEKSLNQIEAPELLAEGFDVAAARVYQYGTYVGIKLMVVPDGEVTPGTHTVHSIYIKGDPESRWNKARIARFVKRAYRILGLTRKAS